MTAASNVIQPAARAGEPRHSDAVQSVGEGVHLNAGDYWHLYALIEAGQDSLPKDADTDSTRAALRAALEFLRTRDGTVSSTQTAPISTKAAPTPFGSYNLDQVQLTIEKMVSLAGLLRDYLDEEAPNMKSNVPHVASAVASSIGLPGDQALGCTIFGGAAEWFMGGNFGEVAHG